MDKIGSFILQNRILIPLILLILSIIVKAISKFRGSQKSLSEIKEDIYSCGIEFSVFTLSVYLCEEIIAPSDFFGIVLNAEAPKNIIISTKFYTLTLIILIIASILFYRSYKNDSLIMKLIKRTSDFIKTLVKTIFILGSIFFGMVSIKLLIDLIMESIEIAKL